MITETTVSRAFAACEAAGLRVWKPASDTKPSRLYDPRKSGAYVTLEGGMIHKGAPHMPDLTSHGRCSGAHCGDIRRAISGIDYTECEDPS